LKYTKNIMNALENFFNMMHRFDYLKEKPAFPIITLDRKTPRWIDRNTQLEALNKTPSLYKPIFTFLMFQGVRPGEAMALKVKDIDFNNGIIYISRTYSANRMRERVKSKVVRPRAINPILINMLSELCKDKHPETFVFLNSRKRHFTDSNLRKAWHKVRENLKIDITLYQATRHSWATNALKDGADLKSIGDILGHTDIRTTLKYAHSDIDNQRAVFKKQHGTVLDIVPRLSPSIKQA
jgi:integrase